MTSGDKEGWTKAVETEHEKFVKYAKEEMMGLFNCDNVGPMAKYAGCKADYNRHAWVMQLTQLVML